jgi:crotonobetainyl-CoA:carnitine CoA-transferase CaiB-like acyl-CoA transferase
VDVFLENYTPGTMERLGLGYDNLRRINPQLIYCSISGYGQTGPYRDKGGYDLMLQGLGGLMSVTGEAGGSPVKVGVPVLDMGGAIYAACGILAAFIVRERTGQGQYVDTSLLDSCAAFFTLLAGKYFATGDPPGRMGSASPMFAPYQAFKTQDIYITVVGTGGKDHWQRFCRALDLEDLVGDPRFATNADRVQNLEELVAIIEERLQTRSGYYWLERLEEEGLPCGPINTFDKVVEDPQVQAREMVIEVEHPVAGSVRMIGIPIKFSETPGGIDKSPPALGQHNEEILGSLGYSETEIVALREEGVI